MHPPRQVRKYLSSLSEWLYPLPLRTFPCLPGLIMNESNPTELTPYPICLVIIIRLIRWDLSLSLVFRVF